MMNQYRIFLVNGIIDLLKRLFQVTSKCLDGTVLPQDDIDYIRSKSWTTSYSSTSSMIRNYIKLENPEDVHNGTSTRSRGFNEGLLERHKVMKWVSIKFGLFLNPIDQEDDPENIGEWFTDEFNLANYPEREESEDSNDDVSEGEGEVPDYDDTWFRGLSNHIDVVLLMV